MIIKNRKKRNVFAQIVTKWSLLSFGIACQVVPVNNIKQTNKS